MFKLGLYVKKMIFITVRIFTLQPKNKNLTHRMIVFFTNIKQKYYENIVWVTLSCIKAPIIYNCTSVLKHTLSFVLLWRFSEKSINASGRLAKRYICYFLLDLDVSFFQVYVRKIILKRLIFCINFVHKNIAWIEILGC